MLEAAALLEAAREAGGLASEAAAVDADVVAERHVREAQEAMKRMEQLLRMVSKPNRMRKSTKKAVHLGSVNH